MRSDELRLSSGVPWFRGFGGRENVFHVSASVIVVVSSI